jgi:hypothetical protein
MGIAGSGGAGENPVCFRGTKLYGEAEWGTETRDIAVSTVSISWGGLCVREGNACSLLKNR